MEMFLVAVGFYGIGVLTMLLPHGMQRAAHWLANSAALFGSAVCAYAAGLQLFGGMSPAPLTWGSYSLGCDGWSAVFLLLTGIAGVVTSLYALGYARSYEGSRLRLLGGMWCLFIMSMVLVLLAGDAFSFLLFWEIMAVASFMLVNHESEKRATWNAAYQYLVMTSVGTAAIMIAFLLTGSASEGFSFAAMAKNTLDGSWQHLVFVCAFAGFALKAGLVPLHVWLPKAHPAAPSHVSALMSGVMLKIALYGFGRFMFSFLPAWNYWWCVVVLLAGVVSAFLGVLYAQMETDIKRVLAYSSVENMGVIFAAFGCGMLMKASGSSFYMLGFVAALVHAFNHSIMKVLMFMCAGSIMHGTGSKNLELFGGLARKMPYTAVFAFVGSLALAAIPLTNGFTGEWLVLQSFISLGTSCAGQDIRLWTAVSFILLGFTGALALGCFVRFFGITFLGRARSEIVEHAHESDKFMLAAMGVASVLVVACGLYPLPVVRAALLALGMPVDLDAFGMNLADGGDQFVTLALGQAACDFIQQDHPGGGGHRPRQRYRVRPVGGGVQRRPRARRAGGAAAACRRHLDQRRRAHRPGADGRKAELQVLGHGRFAHGQRLDPPLRPRPRAAGQHRHRLAVVVPAGGVGVVAPVLAVPAARPRRPDGRGHPCHRGEIPCA